MYVFRAVELDPNKLGHRRTQYADEPYVVMQIEFKSSRMLGPRLPRRLKPTRPKRKRSSKGSSPRWVNVYCFGDDLQAREIARDGGRERHNRSLWLP